MKNRSTQHELLDLGPGYYTQDEYKDCLRKISLVGSLLGGNHPTFAAFANLKSSPKSILDVGCGNGAFTLKLAQKYPQALVLGTDLNSQAIAEAAAYKSSYEKKHGVRIQNLFFEHREKPNLSEPKKSFDVVTATLLCHHFSDKELITFLKSARTIARNAIIINDLHRHIIAYSAFWLLSPLFKNRVLRHDGLLSIHRSFKHTELVNYLQTAGLDYKKANIRWSWGFRWTVTIENL